MVVGVGIGDAAAGGIFGPVPPEGARDPLGWPSHVLALLVIWSAYSILLRAKFEQVAWVLFAVVIAYGNLLNFMINFLIVAFAVFMLVKAMNRMKTKEAAPVAPSTKGCLFCCMPIPLAATRCPHCTSEVAAN